MKLFAQSLMTELEEQLKSVQMETENTILAAELALKIASASLDRLKIFFIKRKNLKKKEEIEFFRYIKPKFVARLIYYNAVYNIETNRPLGSGKTMRKYCKAEIFKLKLFFRENKELYRYSRTGNDSLDDKYFIRTKYNPRLMLDSVYFQADPRFSTSHDYKMAQILANEEIKAFLEEKLETLKKNPTPPRALKKQKWTGSKVELVELIYALHTEGVINDGASGLKEMVNFFESVFAVDLGQFNRVFLEIRNRKSERTKFLNTLKNKLIIRMDNADEN